jgi:hypothetical protein
MKNTQLDSLQFDELKFPYDLITSELNDKPRLVTGSLNTFTTLGGKWQSRPGTASAGTLATLPANRRPVRLWTYETVATSGTTYLWYVSSMFKTDAHANGDYELYYIRADTGSWTSFGSYRALDSSTQPHECVVQRGILYIRGTPDSTSSEFYGTVQAKGSTGSMVLDAWGLPAPTVPCRMSGRTTFLAANIDASTTAVTVTANYSPAVTPNFVIQIDDERMNVTSVGGGTNWTVTRGYQGTTAVTHEAQSFVIYHDWSTSAHAVDVTTGWAYTYAWFERTGHVSNRAPLETNPDLMSSNTFPFFDLIPKMTVQGHADTTHITYVNIYRTQDGGGTFYYVGRVANSGAGNITFSDTFLGTGASSTTFSDPIPDDLLDQANIAPSLVSNTTPPPVAAPSVIGSGVPEPCTNLESYQGRIWFGIGNYLYFSALEEVTEGVPEHCFPAGISGNFFKFQHKIIGSRSGKDALYVWTTQHTYKITGVDKATFTVKPLLHNIGGFNSTSSCRMRDTIAFATNDRRIGLIYPNDSFRLISQPLGDSLNYNGTDFSGSDSVKFHLAYWGQGPKDLLFVLVNDNFSTSTSRVFAYDNNLSEITEAPFWHSPWTIAGTCMDSTKTAAANAGYPRLHIGTTTSIVYPDLVFERTALDITTPFDVIFRTHLMVVPYGNHINKLRGPALSPVIARAQIEMTRIAGDIDPQVSFAYDDFWTAETEAVSLHEPTARDASKWYKTLLATSDQIAARVGLGVAVYSAPTKVEIHNITVTWNPDEGAET